MKLKALERQSGSYGVANAGDIVTVPDATGEELLLNGCWEKATGSAEPATAAEATNRKISGASQGPIELDGTERELLNTVGRKLHDPLPAQVVEAQKAIEEQVQESDKDAEEVEEKKTADADKKQEAAVKDAKAVAGRQTKVDEKAGGESTK